MNISVDTSQGIDMDDEAVESAEKMLASENDFTITVDAKDATPMVEKFPAQNLPDLTKFPLLHSLGVCTTRNMNRLIQELVQFHGNSSICLLVEIIEQEHSLCCLQIRHLIITALIC
jgi:hypothetical protein